MTGAEIEPGEYRDSFEIQTPLRPLRFKTFDSAAIGKNLNRKAVMDAKAAGGIPRL